MNRYVISGGRAGYDRLKLLASANRDSTIRLLQRAGVGLGMSCVDVGCGGGEVAFDLAGLVGPVGHITGLDMDKVKLDLARADARTRGIKNVEFSTTDVTAWDDAGAYDVAYSRFLLQHLEDPVDMMQRMYRSLRSGGTLIIEDADFDGLFCYPPDEGFAFFTWAYKAVLTQRGGDCTIGRKLSALAEAARLPAGTLSAAVSIWTNQDEKRLALLTLKATASAIESEGVASRQSIEAAISRLSEFSADPASVIGGPRVIQLCIRRP